MPRVTFVHSQGTSGEVPQNLTLLEAAEVLGFPLHHDCGGNASCTTCRVDVLVGGEHLSEIDFEEQDLLDREALSESYHRLGCQSRVLGDVIVQVPEDKWGQISSEGTLTETAQLSISTDNGETER
ncbi:MAG: 2Fe-2S iron-sulfur cluster binding domain-containing protein [Nitrospirales bacterium]|nr:2Fe-2S iron-sulfur cluster binding domain-containing protein [Nitrospirales bacterium]